MKAKDLRIGNLVDYEKTTHIVRGFLLNGRTVYSNWVNAPNEPYYQAPIEHHEPISLTDEWLKRFGFQIEDDGQGFRDAFYGVNPLTEDYLIKISYTGKWFMNNMYFSIDYVHQLQNLVFALCGQELEIKA